MIQPHLPTSHIGVGYQYSTVDWGYLAPRPDGTQRYTQERFSGFLQNEWEPTKRVAVTLSYLIDRHPLLAEQHITSGGLVQSPRGTVTWFEKSFDPAAPAGVVLSPYALPAYTLINGRVGYRIIRDKLEAGIAVYNLLGDDHQEHPFGSPIGRRVLFTASGAF